MGGRGVCIWGQGLPNPEGLPNLEGGLHPGERGLPNLGGGAGLPNLGGSICIQGGLPNPGGSALGVLPRGVCIQGGIPNPMGVCIWGVCQTQGRSAHLGGLHPGESAQPEGGGSA